MKNILFCFNFLFIIFNYYSEIIAAGFRKNSYCNFSVKGNRYAENVNRKKKVLWQLKHTEFITDKHMKTFSSITVNHPWSYIFSGDCIIIIQLIQHNYVLFIVIQ